MLKPIPNYILWVLDILHQNQKDAFLVGGCVRDMLMDRECNDYDITTNALPNEVMNIFKLKHCTVIPTGIKHGTISVLIEDTIVEITTYRLDQEYRNHRSPSAVSYTNDLYEDLKRRDFTMNAIAYHPAIGFLDPYKGQEDIQNRIIRCVGIGDERLREDALRILRALRFQTTLQFEIAEVCKESIRMNAHFLSYISKERIRDEFNKILLSDFPNTLQMLRDYQVLPYILPSYEILYNYPQPTPWHIYDIFTHTDKALNQTCGQPIENKLAIIFHDIGKVETEQLDAQGIAHYKKHALVSANKATAFLKVLKYDRKTIEKVRMLILYHDYYLTEKKSVLRRYLVKFDNDIAFAFQALDVQIADDMAKNLERSQEKIEIIQRCKEMILQMEKENDISSLKNLAIDGRDIMELNLTGKDIGKALHYALQCVLDDPAQNTKACLLQKIKENFPFQNEIL